MTEFTVAEAGRGDPPRTSPVVLQRDNWNDYSFQTQYHMYVFTETFSGLIGPVKILKRGQSASDGLQLDVGVLPPLGPEFCALGQSLDYYQRLAELPETLRSEILTHLRDAIADPIHASGFEDESGWGTSLLREIQWDSFRTTASVLLERDYDKLPQVDLDLTFHVAAWRDPLRIRFAAPGDRYPWSLGSPLARLPERITVLTGRNGSGKSTLLARLARVLHASQSDRARIELKRLGTIDPPGVGFTRILNIAYSAFDTFQVPGIDRKERRQIISDLKKGAGRYYFCGLRDIARELEEELNEEEAREEVGAPPLRADRQQRTYLKSADQLADEFDRTIKRIWEANRSSLLKKVITTLTTDPSFLDLGPDPASLISKESAAMFGGWSAGHKIVMHATSSLVAYTEPKSMVLLDEPESHLHPPLLAAFMHAVRQVLDAHDAFAIVATHSPVVAQETLGRHVSVVRRTGETTTISEPRIETYGESIGEITDEVFDLNAEATDYHRTLQVLVESGLELQDVEELFDRGLSLQARAYVMSLLARAE